MTEPIAARPRVTVVVLGYGAEPWLGRCVDSVLESTGVDVDVVLVDNGTTSPDLSRLRATDGVTVLEPGSNLGFSGGCNFGAAHARGEVLVLLNGDAEVRPTALAALCEALRDPSVGIATASLRLGSNPELMNSAGNPVHVFGLSWAGGLDEPADDHADPRDVASASGACLALRRELWEQLGGFPAEFFAYHEDSELSLRCWQAGLRVRYVPDAVAVHHYEFSRNPQKLYLLERNRLLLVATLWQQRTLVYLVGPLLLLEAAMLLLATNQGWLQAKLSGYRWILTHVGWVRRRRRQVQAARKVGDGTLAPLLTAHFDARALALPRAAAPFDRALQVYWRWVSVRLTP